MVNDKFLTMLSTLLEKRVQGEVMVYKEYDHPLLIEPVAKTGSYNYHHRIIVEINHLITWKYAIVNEVVIDDSMLFVTIEEIANDIVNKYKKSILDMCLKGE